MKHKLSLIAKPENMSLEEWQIALRRQAAESMPMSVAPVVGYQGEFIVKSAKSGSTYRVAFHGSYSEWNSCSCMDYRTSALGTCKHMEAVKNYLKGKSSRSAIYTTPSYSSVYVSYTGQRQVRIRFSTASPSALKSLSAMCFTPAGVLKPDGYRCFDDFLSQARSLDPLFSCSDDAMDIIVSLRDREYRKRLIESKYDDDSLDSLVKTKLYPYQKDGVRFACIQGRSIIADEMGLGKTLQAICSAELMRRESLAENIIVVCPTSLKYQWKSEIERFTDAEAHVVEGAQNKRLEQYALETPYKIVSYNAICNDIKFKGSFKCDLVIMDEVQRLKNWTTQIARAARKIISPYAIILSGTPLENKLEELYSIVQLADQFCLGPYYQFRSDHIMTTESGKVVGYQNLNSIKPKLENTLLRRCKADVKLQLPDRIDKNLLVPVTEEQMAKHDELRQVSAKIIAKWNKNHFLTEQDRKRLLLLLSQMRMVCDSTYILDQQTRFDTKVEETMSIIRDLVESGNEKAVVFSQWERMTRIIAQTLEKNGIRFEYLHGGVPSAKRKDMIANFSDDPECRVFLSTDAGATGLNLQAASLVINVDLPWNPAVLEQRIARLWRIGQKNNVQIVNLISRGTIEEALVAKLRFKSSMFEGVLDNGEDTVYADDSKFTAIIDTVGSFFTEEAQLEFGRYEDEQPEPVRENDADSIGETVDEMRESVSEHSSDILAKGLDFFSSLADTLRSDDATRALVDRIVKEDKMTGQVSINIPIKAKKDVQDLLGAFGKLLRNS